LYEIQHFNIKFYQIMGNSFTLIQQFDVNSFTIKVYHNKKKSIYKIISIHHTNQKNKNQFIQRAYDLNVEGNNNSYITITYRLSKDSDPIVNKIYGNLR